MPGFLFGTATTTTGTTSPFSFGLAKTTTAPTAGFSFGLTKTTASTGLLATPAATTTSSLTGFGFNPTTSGTTGFGLGASSSALAATTTTAASGFGGFAFGKTTAATTTAAPTFGLLGNAPAATTTTTGPSLGLGTGLFGTSAVSSATTAPTTSIFTSLPQNTTPLGLGGLDPNTSLKTGIIIGAGGAGDGKTLKESILPDPLAATVESLQKYVKEEKAVRGDIARMSSKPMMKVQEDVTVLRQLLSVVANGLQRNSCLAENLKKEMTQKLKNAEMAQRTKDIPAGLQYENTSPTEYFQHLVEDFEERMVMYRQQIDTLDSHLAALHQPSPHSPSELLLLLKKLHETFVCLAAQLQQVHEAVKNQKDQFLTYRRVYHGDSKNIFHRPAPVPRAVKRAHVSELTGPSPFPDTTNAAAQAMALVHTRAQLPQGPPVTGLVGGAQAGFAGGIFGTPKSTSGFGTSSGLGPSIGGVGNLFTSTSLMPSLGSTPTLGSSTTAALNLASTSLNAAANAKQPFQLQKPPQGAKRGKR